MTDREKFPDHNDQGYQVTKNPDSGWDSWFDAPGVSHDFMESREQPADEVKNTSLDRLKGSIKSYLEPTAPVGVEDWESLHGLSNEEYIIPKSRLRREWRRWKRKIKAGSDVYSTRCGKNPTQQFVQKCAEPPRPLPNSLRRAIERHDSEVKPEQLPEPSNENLNQS